MATQEERITSLEQATKEYRPILQSITYELTMVKGLVVDQVGISRDLREDMKEVRQDIDKINHRLTNIENQLAQILTLLKPS